MWVFHRDVSCSGWSSISLGQGLLPLPLPLDLGDLRHKKPDLVTVEFGDRGNAVDVLDKVFGRTQERLECRLAVAPTRTQGLEAGMTSKHFAQFARGWVPLALLAFASTALAQSSTNFALAPGVSGTGASTSSANFKLNSVVGGSRGHARSSSARC